MRGKPIGDVPFHQIFYIECFFHHDKDNLYHKMSSFPPPSLKAIAEEVAALLREKKETISVAETAAGGLISAALLSTAGASAFYKGGLTV